LCKRESFEYSGYEIRIKPSRLRISRMKMFCILLS
jgi:hypothetical protein